MRLPAFTAERALGAALLVGRAPLGPGHRSRSDAVSPQLMTGGGAGWATCSGDDDTCKCWGIVDCLIMWLRACEPGTMDCSGPPVGLCTCNWRHKY